MADIAIFRINYKSDFILTLHSDAGWATPFCIKFWTGAPSQAYYAGWDGATYTHCAADSEDPTKLTVQFDDHHLPIGDLKFQIGYHFTVNDFPTSVEDEVINQAAVIIGNDGEQQQVMLDFNGETAPEIEFNLPAYAAEAQRIANEEQRIADEDARIENEQRRIEAEAMRETRFASMEQEVETATTNANTAARNAKADYIGEDSYVYHWSIAEQRYVKTDIYVRGKDGKSAYEQAQEGGYEGTEEDFMEMLAKCAEYGGILIGADSIKTFEELNVQNIPAGTFCMYEGKLYRFTIEHEANAEWNPAQVYETNLFKEIDNMIKSDYEEVIITLQTEDGVPLAGVEVVVKVEGEGAERKLTTNEQGRCETNVGKGLEYIVEASTVEGYTEPAKVIRRASLPKRYIEIVYSAILDTEYVVVEVDYADSSLGTATEIYVDIDGEEFTIPLEGNQATFDVDFGKTYTISFQSVDGYMTPHSRTYKAMHASTKFVIARYMKPIDNVKWLMADGTLRELNNVTDVERLEGNIYGCVVGNSELVTNQKCYTIPTQYLLSGQYPYSGNYLSQNIQIPAIGYYDTHGKALLDIDGEFNCTKIREFISEKSSQGVNISSSVAQTTYNTYGGYEEFDPNRDYYAGRSVAYGGSIYQFKSRHNKTEWTGEDVQMLYAGFDSSRSYMVGETVFRGGFLWTFKSAHNAGDDWSTSEVSRTNGWIMPDGTLKHAFTPAYGQLYAYRNIRNDLNTVTLSIFGIQCVPISGASIWTSTQSNADNGVYLNNGGFFAYLKYGNGALLPVLAYN